MLRSIIRLSSIITVIGGLLLGLYQILHPHRDADSVLSHPYALIHDMGMFAVAFIAFGVIGIYLFLFAESESKRSVLFLFFLTVLGTIFEVGALFLDGYINPFGATYVPAIQTAGHTHNFLHQYYAIFGLAVYLIPLTWILFIVGHIGTAVQIIKSKRFGWLPGLLIILGTPMFGMQLFAPLFLETTGAIILGLGYILVGGILYKKVHEF